MTAAGGERPRVVLTRAADQNAALARRLDDVGLEALGLPMIEVQPPADDGRALEAALANLDLYRWLVMTSANGVRAVAAMLERIGRPLPGHLKVAVVGTASAAVAQANGWPVHFLPTAATAHDLAAQFPHVDHGADHAAAHGAEHAANDGSGPVRVLAAIAELGAATVENGLVEKGYQVDHIIAYRTAAPDPRDGPEAEAAIVAKLRSAHAVAFTSPSTVTRFVTRFGLSLVPPVVVCIGPRTAKRSTTLDVAVSAVAEPHNEDGLVQALVAALADSEKGRP